MRIWIPVALTSLLSCAHAPSPASTRENVRAQIESQLARFVEGAKRGDVEAMVSIFEEDALFVVPGSTTQGRTALRDRFRGSLQRARIESLVIRTEVVETSGDLAYEVGTNEGTYLKPDGERTHSRGRYSSVWHRGADGQWRLQVDSPLNDPP